MAPLCGVGHSLCYKQERWWRRTRAFTLRSQVKHSRAWSPREWVTVSARLCVHSEISLESNSAQMRLWTEVPRVHAYTKRSQMHHMDGWMFSVRLWIHSFESNSAQMRLWIEVPHVYTYPKRSHTHHIDGWTFSARLCIRFKISLEWNSTQSTKIFPMKLWTEVSCVSVHKKITYTPHGWVNIQCQALCRPQDFCMVKCGTDSAKVLQMRVWNEVPCVYAYAKGSCILYTC